MTDTRRALARMGWLLVAIACAVGAALGAYSVYGGVITYTAKATMYVTPPTSSTPTDAVMGDQYALNRAELYLQLIDSNELAQRVASKLKTTESPDELAASIEATTLHQAPILTIQAQGSSPYAARSLAQAYVDALPEYARSVERNSGLREDAPIVQVVLPIEVESNNAGLALILRTLAWAMVFGVPVAMYVLWDRRKHPVVRNARGVRAALPVPFVEKIGGNRAQTLRIQALLLAAPTTARQVVFASPRKSDDLEDVTAEFVDSLRESGIHCDHLDAGQLPDFNMGLHSTDVVVVDAPALLEESHSIAAFAGRFTTSVIVVRRGKTLVEDVVELRNLLALNHIEVKGVIIAGSRAKHPESQGSTSAGGRSTAERPWPTIDVLEAEMSARGNGGPVR